MNKFIINGGNKLFGNITIQGSKNAALPILAASILSEGDCVIDNVPDLIDVDNMLKIIKSLGVFVNKTGKKITINSDGMDSYDIGNSIAKELRSSIFLLGAVLSEKKRAIVSYPGGCDIGLRPIDIHIKALRELGVMIEEKSGLIYCDASGIRSGEVYLDYPSVGATENVILATVNLKGTTIIHNAAREPEIIDLQNFINKMGGKVSGAGTTTVIVSGINKLKGVNFSVMSDRIATGTYLLALLICGGEIALESADKADVNSILSKLPKNCCQISYNNDIIYIKSDKRIKSVECISTQPYPGFPTDLQAPFTSLECISEGTCVLTENIFENRFRHVPELRKMGADIIIKDKTAIIKGVKNLTGAETYARDLRGGASLVLAGLAAKGKTVVHDVYHIDRGYDKMDKVLKNLGADIVRE